MPDRTAENAAVKKTLESTYCPPLILDAREAQDRWLRQNLQPGPYRVADIGCGNGYHAVLLKSVTVRYDGFELSEDIAKTARELWCREEIDFAHVFVGKVASADLNAEYDLALCMYFTPGNLREVFAGRSRYTNEYLDRNPAFIRIMKRFYERLAPGGALLLPIYQDVPAAEAAQIDYYENTGQHVVTSPGSRFVATAEGFWSVRWTKRSLLSNLSACGVNSSDVSFHELNEIAWLAEVRK